MTDIAQETIAVLGAGNIGTAMALGLHKAGCRIVVYNRSAWRLDQFKEYGDIECTTSLTDAVAKADMVLICVEGDGVMPMINAMGKTLGKHCPVVGSCAAAFTTDVLAKALSAYIENPRILRLLPNIAATVGHSTNIVCSLGISSEEEERYIKLFEATGPTYRVEERLFKAATSIASCGIAYALRYVRACMSAGVQCGLSPELAKELTGGVLEGCAAMLSSGKHPEELIDSVTTPGGITIRGLNTMEANGFSSSVIAGLTEAAR